MCLNTYSKCVYKLKYSSVQGFTDADSSQISSKNWNIAKITKIKSAVECKVQYSWSINFIYNNHLKDSSFITL